MDKMGLETSLALLSKEGAIARITLNRPSAYNAIDRDMAVCLRDLATDVASDDTVRILIVEGAGPAFCGGGDIRHFVDNLDTIGDSIRALLTPYHEFLSLLWYMPKLTIAKVHGSAAGAGMSLAALCDFCVAATDALFVPAYAKIGVSPDGAGTFALARAVGPRRALRIFLVEDSVTAIQAEEWGLVTKTVALECLEKETARFAERLLRTSPQAAESTKRLLRGSLTADLHDQLIDEMESLIRCMGTSEFENAVAKFTAK